MAERTVDKLTPQMQARLEKWRKNTLPAKSAAIFKGKSPGNYVARSRDHGDDLSDFEALKNKMIEGK